MKTLLLALAAMVATAQTPQTGPRGGCYIVVTKDGKSHKKYIDKSKCKQEGSK
jgi:hypothetical protein